MGGSSPCASCKLLRRRCAKDCVFAPYFPPDDPHKFAIVHKVFGASNVSKMLQELPVHQRADAVSSLVFEANARMRDPVYGCVGAISFLQNQVSQLQMQLAVAQAEILCVEMQRNDQPNNNLPTTDQISIHVDSDDQRSLLLSSNNSPTTNFIMSSTPNYQFPQSTYQLLGFANSSSSSSSSSSASSVLIHVQDPLKRETLWT